MTDLRYATFRSAMANGLRARDRASGMPKLDAGTHRALMAVMGRAVAAGRPFDQFHADAVEYGLLTAQRRGTTRPEAADVRVPTADEAIARHSMPGVYFRDRVRGDENRRHQGDDRVRAHDATHKSGPVSGKRDPAQADLFGGL